MNPYITASLISLFTGLFFYLLYCSKTGKSNLLPALLLKIYEMRRSNARKERFRMRMYEYREVLGLEAPTILGTVVTLTLFSLVVSALLFHLIFFTVVTSGSMSPTFERGDLLLMQAIDKDVKVGDIILFRPRESLTPCTHRVVSIEGGRIRTMGDAVGVPDPWVLTEDDVVAKAVILGGKPVVIKDVGDYFILDYTKKELRVGRYGSEYTFIENLLNVVKAWGYVLCIIAVAGYILLTAREMGGRTG